MNAELFINSVAVSGRVRVDPASVRDAKGNIRAEFDLVQEVGAVVRVVPCVVTGDGAARAMQEIKQCQLVVAAGEIVTPGGLSARVWVKQWFIAEK
ncbi:MAG: hypothetical protein HZC54_00785 [Verrucomicrobia bacterium]|nr:hypothetical protein [Verrucomicrobiota bacterium]